MICAAGEYVFHEHYIAFHVIRENSWSPWRTIGIYATYGQYANCRYHKDYRYMECEFQDEVKEAGPVKGTFEFLDMWRLEHQETHSVISKIVRYCSLTRNTHRIMMKMAIKYINGREANTFAMMAIMLKSRKRYFPVVFQERNKDRPKVVGALREAGLI